MDSDFSNQPLPDSKPIPASLFSRQENKSVRLVNNADPEFLIEGKRRWYNFEFDSAIYVREIQVDTDGYDTFDELEFQFNGIDTGHTLHKIRGESGSFRVSLNKMLIGFSFRPVSKFTIFKRQSIKRIIVNGYTADELSILENALSSVKQEKQEIEEEKHSLIQAKEEAAQKVLGHNTTIDALIAESNQLADQVGRNKAELEGLNIEISSASNDLEELRSKEKDAVSSLETRRTQHREIVSEVEKERGKLEKLKDEIGMFPSQISGFVAESGRNIKNYLLLSLPFLAVIIFVTWSLFWSAVDLTRMSKADGAEIWTVLLTRLPFVVIAVAILQVCGFVVGRFVFEIVQINKQRLNLSKLSIIAKEVASSSSTGLGLSKEEKFDLETHLKMELLREHMKQYVSENYSYKNGSITKIIPEWNRRKKRNQSDPENEASENDIES